MRLLTSIIVMIVTLVTATAQIDTEQVLRIGANTHYFEDYVLSIKYFNQVIAVNPDQAKPYFYRSVAKLSLDDFAGAEEDATMAIERNPFITEAYEVRGVARQNMGKNLEAIADYDHALDIQPENRQVLFNKALALHELKENEKAEETFGKLLKRYPKFEEGYLGRARLLLAMKDTVAAKADIDRALKLNSNAVNAYLLKADIAIASEKDYKEALKDMDMAIRLHPNSAGFYINRAFLRYMTDDFYGAFSDYDKALELEPDNTTAIFNRGLLRAEVQDTNKAIEDFSRVIDLNYNDYKTLYNRAILLAEVGSFDAALADIDRVIDAFPDFAGAYFLRFDIKRRKGDRNAEKDYDKSMALAKKTVPLPADKQFEPVGNDGETTVAETQEQVKKRFSSLTTVSGNYSVEKEYSNLDIRGKVQDKDVQANLEPAFLITYYTSPTEMKQTSEYIREVDEINMSGLLRFVMQVANRESTLSQSDVEDQHRSSIEYYNSYISGHAPRAIDYFGRALDLITIGNPEAAVRDLDRAVSLTPDFTLAYFLRAQARLAMLMHDRDSQRPFTSEEIAPAIADMETVISLSPYMPIARYNKGVMLTLSGQYVEAIDAFSKAIDLKPNFGEAYYNRGYVYLSLGDKSAALPDLSRAGEFGIIPAYPLLKRMSAQ